MLTRVEIEGFKCLHEVSTDLGPFNVLIGPNDSGKSSFLQAMSWPKMMQQSHPYVPLSGSLDAAYQLGRSSGPQLPSPIFDHTAGYV